MASDSFCHFHVVIVAVCLVGLLLSTYAYSVEIRSDRAKLLGEPFRAACDIGPFSCTKVFSSEFGSVTQYFGLPKVSNAVLGMVFYLTEVLCAWSPTLMLLLSSMSLVATAGLAFILTVILHDLCVVCCSIYVVNITTFVLSYRWWRRTQSKKQKERRPVTKPSKTKAKE